ncbi:MAG TPA: SDR family oxidoreductase [Elusimicrobiota bacterium]|jgi:UDP-glucose 4-epimerase|nr:SDR family oxidoreductase [Elusimicrobiota bacterium]
MSGKRRAVVTGGAGFIGSHLVDRLLADGWDVTAIDNGSVGRPRNLAHHAANPALTAVWADATDHAKIAPHFQGAERVFHLAALADIVPSIERPTDYFRSNVAGTESVLEAARAAKVKRFVYAASSSCYGIPEKYPTPETAPIQPQYPYALTKRLGEELVLHWGRVYGMPVVSTRFFNVYGPRARTSGTYGAVFGVFLAQKIHGKPYTVVGDGKQTRDFTYVTDVAAALVKAADSDAAGEIFNVGSGNTYSVNRLVELLGGPVTYIPKRPGEPDCTFADISKIRRVLGWEPKVSLEEGVKRMLERLDDWKTAPLWTPQSIEQATKAWFDNLAPSERA